MWHDLANGSEDTKVNAAGSNECYLLLVFPFFVLFGLLLLKLRNVFGKLIVNVLFKLRICWHTAMLSLKRLSKLRNANILRRCVGYSLKPVHDSTFALGLLCNHPGKALAQGPTLKLLKCQDGLFR